MQRNSIGDRRKCAVWLPSVWASVQVPARLGQTPALRVWHGATVLVPSLSLQGQTKGHPQDSRGIETHCPLVTYSKFIIPPKYTKTQLPFLPFIALFIIYLLHLALEYGCFIKYQIWL